MKIYQPLKNNWKFIEGIDTKDAILERVNSEDNYTYCKGYPLIRESDIKRVKK